MGKQSRLRERRKKGFTKQVDKVLLLCGESFRSYMDAHRRTITNYNEELATILDWVSLNPDHNGVKKFAAAAILRDLNDSQLRYVRDELFSHMFGFGDRNNAAVQILKELPIPEDDDGLLNPLPNLPDEKDRSDYHLYVLNELLCLRPPAYWVVDCVMTVFFIDNDDPPKGEIEELFYPLRVLIDSSQGEMVLKYLDATAWSSEQRNQSAIARFLRWIPYDIYLRTPHWQRVRLAALERANHRCQVCNSAHALNVHHRTYERRGAELPEDVTVLCRACHAIFHKTGRLTREER